MVSQDEYKVELYRRDGEHWQYFLLDEIDDVLELVCIDLKMSMPQIYEDVTLPEKLELEKY